MAQVIKFTPGVSEIIALKFESGKNCTGQFGPQVQFTTVDDRIFWLDETPANDVEKSLAEQGIRTGQEFRITKVKTSHGGHRFAVEAIAARRDAGGHNVPERGRETRYAEPVGAAPAARPASAGVSTPAPPTAAQKTCTQTLAGALIASIDAYLIAVEYAKAKGIECSIPFLEFTADDIRQSATSLMIECFKRGAA